MPLNFRQLASETTPPAANKGAALRQRQETIKKLASLNVGDDLIAATCDVSTGNVVKNWRLGKAGPSGYIARIALDRLGPLLDHMEVDLGLGDRVILNFLQNEPMRTRGERGLELDIHWTSAYEAACNAPLITGIGMYQGLEPIQQRLMSQFRERYEVAAQIGQVATPESTYYF
jgi:hypothetical protein